MKESTARLMYDEVVDRYLLVWYVQNNTIDRICATINDNDDELLKKEKEEGFYTWIFRREWIDVKMITPPKEYIEKCDSAFSVLMASGMRIPKEVKERIDKGIKYLPDVKKYLDTTFYDEYEERVKKEEIKRLLGIKGDIRGL